MRTRIAILVAIVALLLVGSAALRHAQGGALAQSSGSPLARYVVARGAASGGGYCLTNQALRQAQGGGWQASGASSGGGYRLLPALSGAEGRPVSPGGGNQCCCTFLPCVLRSYR